jgi:hypothetical protein
MKYVQATIAATDVALRSLSEGRFLSKMTDPQQGGTLEVNADSIIRHILIVDSATKEITDSTDSQDRGKQLDAAITDLPSGQWVTSNKIRKSMRRLVTAPSIHTGDRGAPNALLLLWSRCSVLTSYVVNDARATACCAGILGLSDGGLDLPSSVALYRPII